MHKYLPNLYAFIDQYDHNIFKNNITNLGIIYRNYHSKNREKELFKISKACKKKRYKLYVSNSIKLALKAKADGLYIPSFNKTKKFLNNENRKFIILGSAHNQKEIYEKIQQNCKIIFISPIFYVKKTNAYLDVHKFNSLSQQRKVNFLALGGINKKNIKKLNILSNIKGFGGISFFKKKPAFKRPVFLKNKILLNNLKR